MQIETKYNIGDVVHFVFCNEVKRGRIEMIRITVQSNDPTQVDISYKIYGQDDNYEMKEDSILTKQQAYEAFHKYQEILLRRLELI